MKSLLLAAMLTTVIGQLPPTPSPQTLNFVGEWTNTKPATEPAGFVPRVKVFDEGGELKVQAWGACRPQNCEWPAVRFWQLRDVAGKDSDRGFAVFRGDTHLAMRLDGAELVVEMYETSDIKINATKTRAQFNVMRYVRK